MQGTVSQALPGLASQSVKFLNMQQREGALRCSGTGGSVRTGRGIGRARNGGFWSFLQPVIATIPPQQQSLPWWQQGQFVILQPWWQH
jgi:hypothetical protein